MFPTNRALLQALLRYFLPYWKPFGAALICMAIAGLIDAALPELLRRLLRALNSPETAWIRLVPVFIVLVFFSKGSFSFLHGYLMAYVSSYVTYNIRDQMFAKLLHYPCSTFDITHSGQLISRINHDVDHIGNSIASITTALIRSGLTIIGLIGYLFYLNWRMALILTAVTPLIVLLISVFGKHLRRASLKVQNAVASLTGVLEENTNKQRDIKLHNGQSYEHSRYRLANQTLLKAQIKIGILSALNSPLIQIVASLAMGIITSIGIQYAYTHTLDADDFIAFMVAASLLAPPLRKLSDINRPIQNVLAAMTSVAEIVNRSLEPQTGICLQANEAKSTISFQNVSFQYPQSAHQVLKNLCLEVQPGQVIAIVGESGAGKSTIAQLLTGLYPIQKGEILIGTRPLRTLSLQSLRSQIALVPQNPSFFSGTIAENIAYAHSDQISEAEILQAAQSAQLLQFIQSLPQGIHTLIGTNGVSLSGGQRQRLALARAFVRHAAVFIFDEPTSALDSTLEQALLQTLMQAVQGKTIFVIAHRFSTIQQADQIVVLSRDQAAMTGSHHTLLKTCPAYQKLYYSRHPYGVTPS